MALCVFDHRQDRFPTSPDLWTKPASLYVLLLDFLCSMRLLTEAFYTEQNRNHTQGYFCLRIASSKHPSVTKCLRPSCCSNNTKFLIVWMCWHLCLLAHDPGWVEYFFVNTYHLIKFLFRPGRVDSRQIILDIHWKNICSNNFSKLQHFGSCGSNLWIVHDLMPKMPLQPNALLPCNATQEHYLLPVIGVMLMQTGTQARMWKRNRMKTKQAYKTANTLSDLSFF